MKFKQWQKLDEYLEQGILRLIDLVFAESVLKKLKSDKQEHATLLAVLFALSRLGHLVLDLSSNEVISILNLNSVDEGNFLKSLLQEGAATFPSEGITEVKNHDDHPETWICRLGTSYYLQKNWIYESKILKHLKRLAQYSPSLSFSPTSVFDCGILDERLNHAQKTGVINALTNPFSLLTGGPGTGKTFTAAQIVKACLNAFPLEKQMRIILTAPTGKAVALLESSLRGTLSPEISIRAGTLHAILGIKSYEYEEEEQQILFADLIIVDECSMIDINIFSRLLAAILGGARLVLIGDMDQLPPVEAGSIFADLIQADVYPTAKLTECLRSDRNEILALSNSIKTGNADLIHQLLTDNLDIHWVDIEEPQNHSTQLLYSQLWKQSEFFFKQRYIEKPAPEEVLNGLGRFSLLSCMRQGPLGVDQINRHFLSQSLKQVLPGEWWVSPIMITRNDYELELYNGDLGVIVRRMRDPFSIRQFHLEDYALFFNRKGSKGGYIGLSALNLSFFEYSYCLSVHKSQGSEYEEVLILMPSGAEMFGREVLYTAVTRARRKVSLWGSKSLLTKVVETSSRKKSGLPNRLALY